MCAVAGLISGPAFAQTTVNSSATQLPSGAGGGGGSATSMWGVGSGGSGASASSSLADSANAHETLGQSAGLVNSAKRGFLYSSGTSIILESIGSQSIVNTSIYGDNNVADITANQTSTNSGNVNAIGSITLGGNATTTTTNPVPGTTSSTTTTSATPSPGNGTSASSSAGTTATSSTTVGKPASSGHQ
jgi:hypothetical protein